MKEIVNMRQTNLINFIKKNLGLVPGICALMGIGISILIHAGKYNTHWALLSICSLAILWGSKKQTVLYSIFSYWFNAMTIMQFLLISAFQLTHKAPFLLSVTDWVIVTTIWFVIFINSVVLHIVAANIKKQKTEKLEKN